MRFIFKNLKKLINIKGIMDNSSEKIFGKNEHKELSSDMEKIVGKNDLLLKSLYDYFKHSTKLEQMLPIINGESKISLRALDWFVTNYAKKNNTIITIKQTSGDIYKFMVHPNYKSQLKAYSKKQFDPFCRRDRITFIPTNTEIKTTVGQLNFFRWCIKNKILIYVEKHINDIEKDMNNSIKAAYPRKKDVADGRRRKKRRELSSSALRSVKVHDIDMEMKF